MLVLKSESQSAKREASPPRQRWRPPLRLCLLLAVLVPALALGIERWRGQSALRSWKNNAVARGEILDPKSLWPAPSAAALEFSNEMAMATGEFAPGLSAYTGQLLPLLSDASGKFRRGTQEPQPPFYDHSHRTNTWEDLDKLVHQSQAGLGYLRDLMKDPPRGQDYDIVRQMETGAVPNFVNIRVTAQSLQTAAMSEVHGGNLPAALEDLRALMAYGKLHEHDPGLINFMIRMAIVGLTVNVCCDALQADGWTEPQLMALQQASQDSSAFLAQMPGTLEAERLHHIHEIESFRSQSYQSWYDSNQQVYKNYGMTPVADNYQKWIRANAKQPVVATYLRICGQLGCKSPTDIVAPWREWVFHPIWSFAWADQEELEYLRNQQKDSEVLRETIQHRSLQQLKQQMLAIHAAYRPPVAAWRFYLKLPLVDELANGSNDRPEPAYPYPDYIHAWSSSMKNITLNEMMITAIALKRFELNHGQPPASLAALVPDYLHTVPTDFMNGQPLGYFPNADGTFTLYSAGNNPQNDGGGIQSSAPANPAQNDSPWDRKYWVWPQIQPRPTRPAATLQTRGG